MNGYSFTLDSTTRINPNDAPFSTYYFWWTSLTYLPMFFFTVLMANWLSKAQLSPLPHLVLALLALIVYLVELAEYLPLNVTDPISSYPCCSANTLLTNALNRYHPFVFYLSFILMSSALSVLFLWHYRPLTFPLGFSLTPLLNSSLPIVQLNLFALWMGSWWALQEGTWGGWWNWDSSEMFGLMISVVLLSMHHASADSRDLLDSALKAAALVLTVLLSYFFIQLNFELVSHNFGSKFFFFFNNNLFFIEALALLSLLVLFLLRLSLSTSSRDLLSRPGIPRSVFVVAGLLRLSIPLTVAYWTLWSYKPLVNYFIWNFLEVNVLNSEISLQPLNSFATLTLLVWVVATPTTWILPVALGAAYSSNWAWVLLLLVSLRSVFGLVHASILALAILNITLYDSTLTAWVPHSPYANLTFGIRTSWVSNIDWTVDTSAWETSKAEASLTTQKSPDWNLFTLSNSPVVNFFTLNSSHSLFQNFYNLGQSYSTAYLNLELPLIPTLNAFFFLMLLLIYAPSNLTSQAKNF